MKKILFIEDDPILGPVYESQLKLAGFEVKRAADGEAGLNALQVGHPDLIVLDLILPRLSGIELLQILRSSPGLNEVPVLVFTNSFQEDMLQRVRQLGAERILSKSQFIPKEVVAVINEVLRGARPETRGGPGPENRVAEAVFQRQLDEALSSCRRIVVDVGRESSNDLRIPKVRMLRTSVRQLTSLASSSGLKVQAYFCEALDAFLGEVCEQPDRLNVSSLRTILQSVDFLFEEFDFTREFLLPEDLTFRVLVVDDDPISRRAVQVALGRIKQQAAECATAEDALELFAQRSFDLVFLDVEMPEINGYDLCTRLRKLEANRHTPVIFVTSHTDLQTRAQSTISGGNDFIGKPFHFMELAVKALLHLLRSKLKPGG
jgi:DNA-binding response OmpR family regulator